MKKNKISKSIKITSLFSAICLFIICFLILAIKFINTDTIRDQYRHIIYNAYKYTLFTFVLIAIPSIVLMLIESLIRFNKSSKTFYDLFRIVLAAIIVVVSITLLFTYSTKYVVKIETWYGHIYIFTSLLVLLCCLMFSFYQSHRKFVYKRILKLKGDDIIKFIIKFNYFKFEAIWLGLSSIVGFIGLFVNKYVAQLTSMIIVVLLVEMCLQISFIFYLNKKQNNLKSRNYKAYIALALLISTVIITVFNISSYYFMYPTDEIGTININNFIAIWNNALTIFLIPCFILSSLRLTI